MPMFERKPYKVEARRVGTEAWRSTRKWCGGHIVKDGRKHYGISVCSIHGAALVATPGDWIVVHQFAEGRRFTVLSNEHFQNAYRPAEG